MRSRLGAHELHVATSRCQDSVRFHRVCSLCHSTEVGDEFHVEFECSFYGAIEVGCLDDRFNGAELSDPAVTSSTTAMRTLLSQNTRIHMVAACIQYC